MDALDSLNKMNIKYDIIEHEPVYTLKDDYIIEDKIKGIKVKSLFLKYKNSHFYIYVLKYDKKADFKLLKQKIGERLEFATQEELYDKLKLHPGSVSPLGIINDNGSVKLIMDNDIKNKKILIHPNRNTATISIEYTDLVRLIDEKNEIIEINE